MKINKIFLGLAVAMMGVLTSCETDVEGITYTPMAQNVSFEVENPSTITTSESSLTIPVRVIRSITNGAYTANFTAEASEEGIFSNDGNGSVTFADGQGVAVVNVTASNLAKGVDYTYTLKLSEAEAAAADTITKTQNLTTTVSIHSDYNWVSGGTCTFVDYTFSESDEGDAAKGIAIQHAEGTNIYRIMNPWATTYGDSDGAGNLQFYLNPDNSIHFDEGVVANIFGYGIYFDTENYPDYCNVEQNGNIFIVNHLLLSGSSLYIGGFAFQWDGWPGN